MAKATRFRSQLLKGTTALLILTVLGDGELYGYEIGRRLRDRSDGAFTMAESSLYPALHRLEAEGALAASWRIGQGGPRRRYYRLTPRGRRMLEAHGRDWEAVVRGVRSVRTAAAHD